MAIGMKDQRQLVAQAQELRDLAGRLDAAGFTAAADTAFASAQLAAAAALQLADRLTIVATRLEAARS